MAVYELTDEMRANLLKLLTRVDIKGAEAMALVEIQNALTKPIKLKVPDNKK